MAQASGKRKCCPHCLEPDHLGEDCDLSPLSGQGNHRGSVSPGLGLPSQSERCGSVEPRGDMELGGRSSASAPRQSAELLAAKVCYFCNDGGCCLPVPPHLSALPDRGPSNLLVHSSHCGQERSNQAMTAGVVQSGTHSHLCRWLGGGSEGSYLSLVVLL